MKVFSRVLAGILLGVGLPISLLAVLSLLNPKTTATDKTEAAAVLLVLGVAPTTAGGWLALKAQQQRQQEGRDRLRAIFFQLLREGNGQITPLRLAMEAGLDGETAKAYLQERATEFDATFNVSEQGTISYYFDLGKAQPELPSPAIEVYDVVVDRIPITRKTQATKAIQRVTGWNTKQTKEAVRQIAKSPVVVQQGVTREVADQSRRILEAIGISVLVVLK